MDLTLEKSRLFLESLNRVSGSLGQKYDSANYFQRDQKSVLLLNERPTTIARTVATANKPTEFTRLIVLFSLEL